MSISEKQQKENRIVLEVAHDILHPPSLSLCRCTTTTPSSSPPRVRRRSLTSTGRSASGSRSPAAEPGASEFHHPTLCADPLSPSSAGS